jgi:hypothetical protein
MKFGLIGSSYSAQSPNANYQKTLNLYLEKDESGSAKSPFQLYPTPGLSLFSALSDIGPIRGILNANERCFAVCEDVLFEVYDDGTFLALGVVGNDGQPASMCNSATQLAVVTGGVLYVVDISTNSWYGPVDTGLGPVKMVGYDDAYFVCLISDSQKFQISSLLDATTWDPTDVTQVSLFPDKVLSMIVDHREIVLFGVTKSVVYGNTGAADFPFSPIPSSYIEQGIGAAWCRDKLDNSVFWLGADDRGRGVAWRLQGYTPSRVSKFAQENEWQSYSTISDAISYSYQDRGHTFWVIYFPTANKTWVYDVSIGEWHERSFLNPTTGIDDAHLSRCHTFVFGQHLVGSRVDGSVYVMNTVIPDDDGYLIKRQRRSPHISNEQKWIYHSQLQLDAQTGGSITPPTLGGFVAAGPVVPNSSPVADIGNLDVIAMAILNDGSRYVSLLMENTRNDAVHTTRITLPAITGLVTWRIYFCATGDDFGTCYFVTLVQNSATAGYTYDPALGGFYYIAPTTLTLAQYSLNWILGIESLDTNNDPVLRNPIVWLNYSDDGGHVFKNQIEMNLGQPGDYAYRCITRRLGRSRDRIYNFEYSDTAPLRLIDAYLEAQ